MIINEPKKYIGDYAVDAVRAAYENRGRWYYYLVEEGLRQGLTLEFAREAMRDAGSFQYSTRFRDVKEIPEFVEKFMTYGVEKVNEGEIVEQDSEHVCIELGYCPLVAAWQKLTDDSAYLAQICDCCMEMDRGIAAGLGWEMNLEGTIASGDGKCRMCWRKK